MMRYFKLSCYAMSVVAMICLILAPFAAEAAGEGPQDRSHGRRGSRGSPTGQRTHQQHHV